jgi:serine phosphatase RsbU (regulator of sigma subunit)
VEEQSSPAAVLSVVNRVFYEGSNADSFATVFFAILDCTDGRLVYCNAGHTTGAVARIDRKVDELRANSPLVGALPWADFIDSETRLGAGDTLFLYTDGLTEARSGKDFFGEERLMRLVRKSHAEKPDELVHEVVEGVLKFTGGTLTDDIAVFALRRN